MGLITDNQAIRQTTLERKITQANKVLAIFGDEDINERITAIVIAIGCNLLASLRINRKHRIKLRIQSSGVTSNGNPLIFLRSKLEDIFFAVVGCAIDYGVDFNSLRGCIIIVGFFFIDFFEATRDGKQAGVAYTKPANSPAIVRASGNSRIDCNFELFIFEPFGLDARMIEF